MNRLLACLLLALICLSWTVTASAQTYDAAADFTAGWNAGDNPNGVWSYGWSTGLGATLNLYPSISTWGGNGGNELFWFAPSIDAGFDPTVAINAGPAIDNGNIDFLANEIVLTANPYQYSHVVFTAPVSGSYSVAATFRGDQHGATADVYILGNGSLLYNATITSVGQTASFMGTASLSAGQTIDFAVLNPAGYWNTGLSATISLIPSTNTSVHVTSETVSGNGVIDLYARLVQNSNGPAIAGQTLSFWVDGSPVGTATTDAFGKAQLAYTPTSPGAHSISVQFAGSGLYQASSGAGTLTVNLAATTVTVNAASGRAGHSVALLGTLTQTSGGVGLAGQTVTISIDGNAVGTSTTVRYGKFGIDYPIPANTSVGPHTITVTFGGSVLDSPGSGSNTLTVTP